jgi:flagellar assembly protein FliH
MAGIIKAGQTVTGGGSVQPTTYQFADVSQQANAYVTAARAQAQEILAAARRDADALRTRAEQQGMQAALAKAEEVKRKELARQLETLMPAMQQAIEAFDRAREDWLLQPCGWPAPLRPE